MNNHLYIYLGMEKGKSTVYKVGMTTQTCWSRCRNSDYTIGFAFEIIPDKSFTHEIHEQIESEILEVFTRNFDIAHGREYFKVPKAVGEWEEIKTFFADELTDIMWEHGYCFDVHDEWVRPRSY